MLFYAKKQRFLPLPPPSTTDKAAKDRPTPTILALQMPVAKGAPIHFPPPPPIFPTVSCHLPTSSTHFPSTSAHLPIVSCHLPASSIHLPSPSAHLPIVSCHLPASSTHLSPLPIHLPPEADDLGICGGYLGERGGRPGERGGYLCESRDDPR